MGIYSEANANISPLVHIEIEARYGNKKVPLKIRKLISSAITEDMPDNEFDLVTGKKVEKFVNESWRSRTDLYISQDSEFFHITTKTPYICDGIEYRVIQCISISEEEFIKFRSYFNVIADASELSFNE
tara:strand:- start:179 stop:565 length:387 start_codon:yes stop_codon:yes gene_type:complete